MEQRVSLFPGVTVPKSIADWVRLMPDGDLTQDYGMTVPKEDSPEGGIGDIVEQWLIESRRATRIEETKSKAHGWRRDENKAKRERVRRNKHPHCRVLPAGIDSMIIYTEPSNRKPIVPLLTELADLFKEEVPAAKHLRGVNAILEYIGFQTEPEKTSYLRSFNRYPNDITTYRGVDAVRTGWHIALFYGKTDDKGFVKAAIQSVGTNGTRLTDATIQRFGAESLQDIVKNYSSLRINGLLSLVPTSDLGRIISAMRDPILGDIRGPAFMQELGFQVYRLNRTPILYSKPISR